MTEAHGIKHPGHCKLCNISFALREETKDHRFQVHGKVCSVCDKAFLKVNRFEKHMKKFHGTPIEYPCTICGVIVFTEALFAKHLETHQSPETKALVFRCDFCSKPFFDAAELQSHARIHDDPTECPFCHQMFPRKNPMKRHKRLLHPREMEEERKKQMKRYKRELTSGELEKFNQKREKRLVRESKPTKTQERKLKRTSERKLKRSRKLELARRRLMESKQTDQ